MIPDNRPVRMSFGLTRPKDGPRPRPLATVVGIVPSDAPWYADRLPTYLVRDMRRRTSEGSLEHLRLTPTAPLSQLPGLSDPRAPSRVADTVATMLLAGCPAVDVVLIRAEGAGRVDFRHPSVREQLLGWLPELGGSVLCFPDLGEAPARHTWAAGAMLARSLRDTYSLALFDLPTDVPAYMLVEKLVGADVGLCRWVAPDSIGAGQSWRSAAAVVAGRLAGDVEDSGRSLCRRAIRLPPPRRADSSRLPELTPRRRAPEPEADGELLVDVDIDALSNSAVLRTEPSLRDGAGRWPLPALHCVKQLRRSLVEAAEQHVFRPVNEQEAFALAGGLATVMRPYLARGVLSGPGGEGVPAIEAGVVRDPAAPGLVATIDAYLRPWMFRVDLRVQVQHGGRPEVVEG